MRVLVIGLSFYMKLSKDKCHFIISGYKHEMFANIEESWIWEKGQ